MIAQRMFKLCGIPETETRRYIEQEARTFYAYAMASRVMYKKPTVELRKWSNLS